MGNKRKRKVSGKFQCVSDTQLKEILEKEYKENPENFSNSVSEPLDISSSQYLSLTAGKGIDPLKKWL